MPQPLPRLYAALQKWEDDQRIAQIILETGERLPEDKNGKPLRVSADGHRDDRRRGLPVIGRGTSGAIPGTDPVRALLSKERRRR